MLTGLCLPVAPTTQSFTGQLQPLLLLPPSRCAGMCPPTTLRVFVAFFLCPDFDPCVDAISHLTHSLSPGPLSLQPHALLGWPRLHLRGPTRGRYRDQVLDQVREEKMCQHFNVRCVSSSSESAHQKLPLSSRLATWLTRRDGSSSLLVLSPRPLLLLSSQGVIHRAVKITISQVSPNVGTFPHTRRQSRLARSLLLAQNALSSRPLWCGVPMLAGPVASPHKLLGCTSCAIDAFN
jgi:hypothetical protein